MLHAREWSEIFCCCNKPFNMYKKLNKLKLWNRLPNSHSLTLNCPVEILQDEALSHFSTQHQKYWHGFPESWYIPEDQQRLENLQQFIFRANYQTLKNYPLQTSTEEAMEEVLLREEVLFFVSYTFHSWPLLKDWLLKKL